MIQTMDAVFKILYTSRKIYLGFFDQYSTEQLNKVPAGFSNNLIWNIGHIIVAQQSLVYRLSGLPVNIPDELTDLYKPGTKPTGSTSPAEIQALKELLLPLAEQTEQDFKAGKFVSFTERMTGTGFHLTSLEDAMAFNNYHEGLHLGYMSNIRKFV